MKLFFIMIYFITFEQFKTIFRYETKEKRKKNPSYSKAGFNPIKFRSQ